MRRRTLVLVVAVGIVSIAILIVALSGARDVPAASSSQSPAAAPTAARPIDVDGASGSEAEAPDAAVDATRDRQPIAPDHQATARPGPAPESQPTRVVRGFVVDLAGDPVLRIPVVLVPTDDETPARRTLSDGQGAFAFAAPLTGARVEADGGDVGQDRAWVGAGDGEQVIELVLEPVGTVTVLVGRTSPRTHVSLRTRDPKALGPDRSWETPAPIEDSDVAAASDVDAEEVLARRVEIASGRIGEPITLPANVWYDVVLSGPRDDDRSCGRVMLAPGDDRVMRCEVEPTPSTLTGRIVTRDGAPAPSVALTAFAGGAQAGLTAEAMAGPDGRFGVTFDLSDPALIELSVRGEVLVRRNVVLSPGDIRDIGDVLLLTGDAVPDPWPDGAYGGIGGLVAFGDDGVTVLDMETDSPLYLDGVERDDTIVLVDGLPLSEMPDDEALVRLRGPPGTHVELRLRSARGELYDLVLERKLMAAPSETWDLGGARPPEEPKPEPIPE